MERYSNKDNLHQYESQQVYRQTVREAADALGLDRLNWLTQQGGDGELAILPADAPETAVVARLAPALDRLLRRHNRDLEPHARVRLRVAIHSGLVHLDGANGYPGDAVVTVCRLVDADPLKSALAAFPGAGAALIVSDQVYQDVVRHGYDGIRVDRFRRVSVRMAAKRFDAVAWITVPDEDVTALAAPSAPAAPAPPVPGAGTVTFTGSTFNGPVAAGDHPTAWMSPGEAR
ncbi:hypothetical protein [Phytohabitans rumicis]|nr:hypothetical protein [Phytohabitans rumicis]